jgi:hypothetical protein
MALIRLTAPNPDFKIGVKSAAQYQPSIPWVAGRGVEWVDLRRRIEERWGFGEILQGKQG